MQKRRSFRQVDYVVIAVLYVGDIVDVWTGGWVAFTDDVVFGVEDDDNGVSSPEKGSVRIRQGDPTFSALVARNSLMVLSVKCVLCFIIAFSADLRNRKFLLYLASLCLWVLTPVAGIATALSRSSTVALSLSWLAAVLFVTSPLKYCLIFNQRLNPPRDQTRLVVALFEFMIGTCTFLLHACSSNRSFAVSTLVAVWAALVTPLGIIVILLTIAIRSHCTSEKPKQQSFKELCLDICQDVAIKKEDPFEIARQKKRASLRFVMFALLLCPAIAVTIIFEAHEKVSRTLTKEVKLERSWFEFSGALTNLLAIPVVSLVVSLSKGTRGTFWDYMVLAFAHALNTTIMLLIYLYFRGNGFSNNLLIPPSNPSTDPTWLAPITEEVPGKGVAVVCVYFHGDAKREYFFQSSLNENPKKVVYVRESVPVKDRSLKYDFSIWEEGSPRLNQSILVREKKRYFFLATGSTNHLKELIYMPDVKDFTPENAECIIVMSSIAEGVSSVIAKRGIFAVSQQEEVIRFSQIPHGNSSIQWCVPAENTTFSFEIQFTNLLISRFSQKLKPFRESLLMVSWEPGPTVYGSSSMVSYIVAWYEVSNVVNRTKTLLGATHGLEGVVAAAAKIGYVQFFWMEAPFRLRTTIFACVVVANEVAKWLVELLFEEIREKTSLTLLILSFSAGLVHVLLGAFYDFKLRKDE